MKERMPSTDPSQALHDKGRPVPVSSASSLDSFLLPTKPAGNDLELIGESSRGSETRADPRDSTQHTNPRIRAVSASAQETSMMSGSLLFPGTTSPGNSVPEFLFQLTKMLTEDNTDIIEWSQGLIKVHSPLKLESQVLHKYFRHSKFSSFQRQLNYFGFRKLAGKGKMAPCSYANEAAGEEINSLLFIKRKAGTSTSAKDKNTKKKVAAKNGLPPVSAVNAALAGILHKSPRPTPTQSSSHLALAKSAVGRGIRHGFMAPNLPEKSKPAAVMQEASETPASVPTVEDSRNQASRSLSQLAENYQNSLTDLQTASQQQGAVSTFGQTTNFLGSNSSLVDLAMIPAVDDTTLDQHPESEFGGFSWNFVDFPYPEILPNKLSGDTERGEGASAP